MSDVLEVKNASQRVGHGSVTRVIHPVKTVAASACGIGSDVPGSQVTRARLGVYIELAKPRIAVLVLVATALGFFMGGAGMGAAEWILLLHTLIGTGLVAGGANALNQYLEADLDAKMDRTRDRPLPSGRLTPSQTLTAGVAASAIGVVHLTLLVNPLAASLAAATLLSYVLLYTPLKRVTAYSLFVGAVPGALPPIIGWAAAAGHLPLRSWLLFLIVFFWQLPHFMAIAWMYREDYRRAGFPVVPVIDPDGTRTNVEMISHSVALLMASLLPTLYGLTGTIYAVGAMALGLGFLLCGVLFVVRKNMEVARLHLLASVIYLPALLLLMLLDKVS